MWRDIRNAVRTLFGSPGFTLSAALALSLAIGANGAIFGLVDALWFRPPGVRDPATLVRVFAMASEERDGPWSWPEVEDLRQRASSLEAVAARGRRGAVLVGRDGEEELLLVNVVSTNFFEALGVRAAAGRLFTRADAAALEASPSVVLGHAFWITRFGGDPGVIGRTLQLGRGRASAVTVVGVLPPGFRDLEAAADRDLWLPPQTWARLAGGTAEFEDRGSRWFDVVGRRRPTISPNAVDAEVRAIAASLAQEHPALTAGRGARAVSERALRRERGGVPALALLGLVLIVVLITCVNVTNLLLARAAARSRELAVRAALGASRWRLIRQLGAESAVLGVLGAVGGLIAAAWLIRLLPSLLVPPPGIRALTAFQTDVRVMLFTAAVAIVTTLLIGLAPAWTAARADVVAIMKSSAGTLVVGGRVRRILTVAQVAVSLVLLSAAADLARSFAAVQRADLGFTREPVLTLWTTFGSADHVTGAEAVRRLEALPGVVAAAVAVRAPLSLSGGGLARPVAIPGAPIDPREGIPRVKFNAVSANYFDVLGTRVLRGRAFTADDERGGEAAVIVTEAFARRYLEGRDPLGALLHIGPPPGEPHRIVGIAQDGVVNEIGEAPQPYMYLPFWRGQHGETTFFVAATGGDASALASPARAALRQISPRLEPRRAITMAQYIEFGASLHRTTAALGAGLGLIGLLLTAIGVYGVVSYRTARRTRELGIRVALGADRSKVLRLVLRDGLALGAAGVAAGLPLALAARGAISSMLVGLEAWDAPAFAIASAILLLSVCLAALLPARRATRVAPVEALRQY